MTADPAATAPRKRGKHQSNVSMMKKYAIRSERCLGERVDPPQQDERASGDDRRSGGHGAAKARQAPVKRLHDEEVRDQIGALSGGAGRPATAGRASQR